jgi:hypothetical protein
MSFLPSQGSGKVEIALTVKGTLPAVEVQVQVVRTPRLQEGLRHGLHTAPATTNKHKSISFELSYLIKVEI